MIRCVALGLFALLVATGAAAETSSDAALPEGFEAALHEWAAPLVEQEQLSGRLLVSRGESSPIIVDFGRADRELDVPIGDTTRFNIASVTKTVTVLAMAGLLGEGKLALSDTIGRWLPDFPSADVITVEMLVRHTAGVSHRVMDEILETQPTTAAEMTARAARKGLDFEPGSRTGYSSGGYAVLARVLELAAGRSYSQLLDRYVFERAGMSNSAHVDARTVLPGRAESYVLSPAGTVQNAPLKDLSFLVGGGSVWSTAGDLHRMLAAIRAGRYGARVQQEMIGESGFRANGVTSGFRAFVDWHAESDTTVVFTGNLVTGAANLLRDAVPRLAAGESVASPSVPSMQPYAAPPEALEELRGSYQLRPGRTLDIEPEAGGLKIAAWVLIPTGPDRFVSPQDYGVVTVVRDERGNVSGLEWTSDGRTSSMPRVDPQTE